MNKNSENSKLLDALLTDETWDSDSTDLRNHALDALRASRKARARRTAALQITAILAVLGVIGLVLAQSERGWPSRSSPERAGTPEKGSMVRSDLPSSQTSPVPVQSNTTYITEEQMLAMFPQGSCVLAEIDGQKQLVLLGDAAAEGILQPDVQ
jgi:hypothetical protein